MTERQPPDGSSATAIREMREVLAAEPVAPEKAATGARTNRHRRSRESSNDDAALVQRFLSGDEDAFAALVDCYHPQLIRLALAYVADRATAEEVVQDTWLGVLAALETFEGRSRLKTWIFRILTNRAKTRGVRESRSVPFSSLTNAHEEDEPAVDSARFEPGGSWADPPRRWDDDTPEKLLLRAESMRLLEEAIADLQPNQRAVVTLRDIEGMESEEICNILEISETNQRVLLHRARSSIRRALEGYIGCK